MDKLKKIIALLLSFGMILTSASYVFAAENFDDDGNRDNENGLSDEEQAVFIEESHPFHELDNPEAAYIEDLDYDEYIRGKNEYNETVKKLTSFGMWVPINEGIYLEHIKAGEFCLSVCRYVNMDLFYKEDGDQEKMWETACETLRALGYLDFDIAPSDEITYDKALRLLVNALGYKPFIYMYGGGNNAYMQIADEFDIVSRFPEDISAEITRAEAAALIEETITADVYVSYGTNDYRNFNALEYFKKSYKITGIVEAVSDRSITNGDTIEKGIIVDGYALESDRKDLYEYLACNVEAYYRDEGNEQFTLLYISYHKKNNMLTIEGKDIDGLKNNKIVYYTDGNTKSKRLTLDSSAIEILDGFAPKNINSADFENCDYITAVDNNNDGKYDVVFVYKYDIMVVKRIVESQDMIYGLYNDNENGSIKVDFDSGDIEMTDRMGNPVEAYYITKDSVLSVANDTASSKQKIIVSNLMYTGVVKSTESGDDPTVGFEDRSYTYSTNSNYFTGSKAMFVGNKYNVYLDYKGRIAGYDLLKADEMQYGFLIKAWLDNETGDDRACVKLLPYAGDMANFYLADKTKVDGISFKSAEKMYAALRQSAYYQRETLISIDTSYEVMDTDNSRLIYLRVPVIYKLNDNGEINYIDTPYHSQNENPQRNDVFHDNTMTMYNDFSKRTATVNPGGMYLRNTLAFNSDNGNNVAVNSKTKVFIVPVSNDISEINDSAQYIKTNLAYFDDWSYYPKTGTQYTIANRIEAYNVDETRTAGILVYYTSDVAPEIDKKVPLTVVDKIVTAADDDGDPVTRLIGWQGNAQIQVDLAEGFNFTRYYNGPAGTRIKSDVRHGDIIRYVTNNKGELVDYVKVFSLKDEDDPDYVKTGNEEGVSVDPTTLNKTMLAVSDGKYAANGHNTTHIYTAIGNYNYGATYRLVYGTLLYKNGTNLVLKTKVDTALGQLDKIEIADFSGYNVLMIDETTNKIYVPTENELLAEQGAGEDASKVILHTEGGKQRQLIIIKRAK